MHTKKQLLTLLERHGLRLSKRLGQHFLVDADLCRSLVQRCGLSRQDRVVEIGPGLGALTDLLAEAAGEVVAVEIDSGICRALQARMAERANVRVLCQDILTLPWDEVAGSTVVGAIPYQITSPILAMLCQPVRRVPQAWVAMQEEVGERLAAGPGTKSYGRLSILVQYHFEVRRAARVSRQSFFPQPDVDSLWMHLKARPRPLVRVNDEALFFELTRVAFGQRRKTLLNCLLNLPEPALDRPAAAEAIRRAGLPPSVRGETLSIEQFARLADILHELR